MANPVEKRSPRWYGIPLRVVAVTFIGTLMAFAVSLLLAIIGMIVASAIRGTHPDMRIAYRVIALPMGLVAGGIVFVLSLAIEIRHYRQMKTLSAIERVS
jgi:peptidoglycan biosynthesis protein MviN/MurJ (putative lipid II flippase)